LLRFRIEFAKQLLVDHDLTLKEIARLCGYRSECTFCVAFQRKMKVSPKKYQRQVWLDERRRQQTDFHPAAPRVAMR